MLADHHQQVWLGSAGSRRRRLTCCHLTRRRCHPVVLGSRCRHFKCPPVAVRFLATLHAPRSGEIREARAHCFNCQKSSRRVAAAHHLAMTVDAADHLDEAGDLPKMRQASSGVTNVNDVAQSPPHKRHRQEASASPTSAAGNAESDALATRGASTSGANSGATDLDSQTILAATSNADDDLVIECSRQAWPACDAPAQSHVRLFPLSEGAAPTAVAPSASALLAPASLHDTLTAMHVDGDRPAGRVVSVTEACPSGPRPGEAVQPRAQQNPMASAPLTVASLLGGQPRSTENTPKKSTAGLCSNASTTTTASNSVKRPASRGEGSVPAGGRIDDYFERKAPAHWTPTKSRLLVWASLKLFARVVSTNSTSGRLMACHVSPLCATRLLHLRPLTQEVQSNHLAAVKLFEERIASLEEELAVCACCPAPHSLI